MSIKKTSSGEAQLNFEGKYTKGSVLKRLKEDGSIVVDVSLSIHLLRVARTRSGAELVHMPGVYISSLEHGDHHYWEASDVIQDMKLFLSHIEKTADEIKTMINTIESAATGNPVVTISSNQDELLKRIEKLERKQLLEGPTN